MWLWVALAGCGPVSSIQPSDADGDGVVNRLDCAPDDPAVFPGAPELCNGVDDDCDTLVDEDLLIPSGLWVDADGDGYGGAPLDSCDPTGAVAVSGDCDDADAGTHPGGIERCGGGDEDCDGLVDDADPDAASAEAGATKRYPDGDGDGYGFGASYWTCDPTTGADNFDDCDDGDSAVHPGAIEVCDDFGVDEDCDGLVDDQDPSVDPDGATWWVDADADGFGDPYQAVVACSPPDAHGWAANGDDCNDGRDSAHPGAPEVCGGGDDDCDGLVDDADPDLELDSRSTWGPDADGDGFGTDDGAVVACAAPPNSADLTAGTDCDDDDADTWPGAPEICGDGVDQDCVDGDLVCPTLDQESMESPDQLVETTALAARVGTAVDAAGDIDGDGFGDYWVSAPGWGGSGRVALIHGGAFGTRSMSAPDAWIDAQLGIGDFYEFGAALRGTLDFDGDGAADLLASAPFHPDDTLAEGHAYLFVGPFSGGMAPAEDVAWRVWRADTGAYLGSALDAGDVDGNGRPDVALTAPGDLFAKVYVDTTTFGAGDVSTADLVITGVAGMDFGHDVLLAPLGETGLSSIVLTAPDDDLGRGWVGVFDGTSKGALDWTDALTTADGEIDGGRYGDAVGAPGDVFGDGTQPLMVAEHGSQNAFLYEDAVEEFTSDKYAVRIGSAMDWVDDVPLHSVGDLDGDGSVDLAASGDGIVAVWFGPVLPAVLLTESAEAIVTDVVSAQHAIAGGGGLDDGDSADLLVGDVAFGDADAFGRTGLFYGDVP